MPTERRHQPRRLWAVVSCLLVSRVLVTTAIAKDQDDNEQCWYWASHGECDKNPKYMTKHCPESCQRIQLQSVDTTADGDVRCAYWAETGECEANPKWMERTCRQRCRDLEERPDGLHLSTPDPPPVVSSIATDLDFDEHGKLSTYYVVFPANQIGCPTERWERGLEIPGMGYTARPVAGPALATIFPHYGTDRAYRGSNQAYGLDSDDNSWESLANRPEPRCLAACLEKGTDVRVAGHTMPHLHFPPADDDESSKGKLPALVDDWFPNHCGKLEVCFLNYVLEDRPLPIYFVDAHGNRTGPVLEVHYGEDHQDCLPCFSGHTFVAHDDATSFVQTVTVRHTTTVAFGSYAPSTEKRHEYDGKAEEKMKLRAAKQWKNHFDVRRTFSSLGFSKGRLPDDVFAGMAAFYHNNRDEVVPEYWKGLGYSINWWEAGVTFLALPPETKHRWQLRLKDLVEDWAGVPLEETSMYGLRQYEGGCRLTSHVDRLRTHAVSLIVNVAQTSVGTPWPVDIHDHGDRMHEIPMAPGDVIYYESAKALHGRNRPLTCVPGTDCAYVNLFTHYRPVRDATSVVLTEKRRQELRDDDEHDAYWDGGGDGDDFWYENLSDVPNRPPALVRGMVDFDNDVGACRRRPDETNRPKGTMPDNSSSVGADTKRHNKNGMTNDVGIGSVVCDDDRLGTFVSPTLFRLQSADDMFRWWKATRKASLIGFDDESGEPIYLPENTDSNEDASELPTENLNDEL